MIRSVATLILISTTVQPQVAFQTSNTTVESANPVVEWNNNLLALVRTPGGQPGTIHIDGTHSPYRIQILGTPPRGSQGAAAAAAANEVLIGLYPSFRATLDRRPVTAIRAADSDDNLDTATDPNWLPELGNTAAEEATFSRIFDGAHFRSDLEVGLNTDATGVYVSEGLFGSGETNPLVFSFAAPVQNFSVLVLNGDDMRSYTVSDNLGDSATNSLVSAGSLGGATFSLLGQWIDDRDGHFG
jgi:hypothetical protein